MAQVSRYPQEVRDRAVRLVLDLLDSDEGEISFNGACRQVAEQLGLKHDTLRGWTRQARVDAGQSPGVRSEERRRITELERENRELRRANAILKTASAFFAAELDRPLPRSSGS